MAAGSGFVRTIRVVVADDHPLVHEAVRLALGDAEDIEVVGAASSGREFLELVRRLDPDAALLDLRMPGLDGLACIDQLRAAETRTKILVLSGIDDERMIAEALRRGATAFILKTVDPRDLAAAIRQAVEATVFTPLASPRGGVPSELDRLTAKEQDVLRALARGLSNQEIARDLWLAEQTVKFHLTNIYRKLKVANRTEAARLAYRHGLVTPGAGKAAS